MLATAASKPFDRPNWIFELKYDGFRVLAIRDQAGARLLSRRGNDLSPAFPEIVACLMELESPAVASGVLHPLVVPRRRPGPVSGHRRTANLAVVPPHARKGAQGIYQSSPSTENS
jgi:hypothetical protein